MGLAKESLSGARVSSPRSDDFKRRFVHAHLCGARRPDMLHSILTANATSCYISPPTPFQKKCISKILIVLELSNLFKGCKTSILHSCIAPGKLVLRVASHQDVPTHSSAQLRYCTGQKNGDGSAHKRWDVRLMRKGRGVGSTWVEYFERTGLIKQSAAPLPGINLIVSCVSTYSRSLLDTGQVCEKRFSAQRAECACLVAWRARSSPLPHLSFPLSNVRTLVPAKLVPFKQRCIPNNPAGSSRRTTQYPSPKTATKAILPTPLSSSASAI